jgi:hypothetical protein
MRAESKKGIAFEFELDEAKLIPDGFAFCRRQLRQCLRVDPKSS